MPTLALGLNADQCERYMHFITNRRYHQPRCGQMGPAPFDPDTENPFLWMSQMMDLKEEKFFEAWVTEYQSGAGLAWERGHPTAGARQVSCSGDRRYAWGLPAVSRRPPGVSADSRPGGMVGPV